AEPPLQADEVERAGVVLIDVPEGKLNLAGLPALVNRTCYELGLTEDRWGWESGRLVETSGGPSISSRPLPVATARDACPVGYVHRPWVEERLGAWKKAGGSEEAPRRLLTVVGPARLGKTTLLGHWLLTDKESWPRFPVWFSFVRHATGRDRLADLRQAL